MANIVQIKRSAVAGKVPLAGDLEIGELAINFADGLIYSKNTTGNVVVVASINTSNISEVDNLYFTNSRVIANVVTYLDTAPYVNVTNNLNVTGSIITPGFEVSDTFTLGSQILYAQGTNGFSVNEDFDPSNNTLQTAYHFTSGAGRETVAFTLARTGQFTDGFGIYGTSADNKLVMFGEQTNTSFEWRKGVGIQPLDLDGGTLLANISSVGNFYVTGNIYATNFIGNTTGGGGSSVTVASSPPGSPSEGDLYWDEELGRLYIYYTDGDSSQWVDASPQSSGGGTTVNNIVLGRFTSESFVANGTGTTFVVGNTLATTSEVLVFVDGVIQEPVTNYGVNGTVVTFTSAPDNGSNVFVRYAVATEATLGNILPQANLIYNIGNNEIQWGTITANLFIGDGGLLSNISGGGGSVDLSAVDQNIIPAANVTYNLGSPEFQWKDLYLSGSTINLGGAQLKTDGSGAIALIPSPTVDNPNPKATIVSPTGAISAVETTGGEVDSNTISEAALTSSDALITNSNTITSNVSVVSGQNALIVGPINISANANISISPGSRLIIL